MSTSKDLKRKMMIKQTLNAMDKQIQKLEDSKAGYIKAGREASAKGLTTQYNLALQGLRMTIEQQTRLEQMKLTFEITAQMHETSQLTASFLKGMTEVSREMKKMTKEKDFLNAQMAFEEGTMAVEQQGERIEGFMDTISTGFGGKKQSEEDKAALEELMNPGGDTSDIDAKIEREMQNLKKQMQG